MEKRTRDDHLGISHPGPVAYGSWNAHCDRPDGRIDNHAQPGGEQRHGHYRQRVLGDAGVVAIEALLVMVILTFLTFAGIDFWVLQSKHQYAEHIMEKYLERMAIEGRLSTADEAALIADFASVGLPVESITAQRESQGNARILRNPADVNASTVSLRIVARPDPAPLLIGNLISGTVPGAGYRIVVGGATLSERVAP